MTRRAAGSAGGLAPRPPDSVMRLARMGAAFPTRLAFMRTLVRRMGREAWSIRRDRWDLDPNGLGAATYVVATPHGDFSLVAFTRPLADAERTDRVIAEKWDASFVLVAGRADARTVERLAANAPSQEAGRYTADDLVLSRANRSVRLFAHVVDSLAAGRQPDGARLAQVGYLMRTTAVYGNGKFGLADRGRLHDGPVLDLPFQAEMLTVYLIRQFTFDLVDHIARGRAGGGAATLAPASRRALGIGNATGLGMAPFLIGHPALVHRWFLARETAIARVRAVPRAEPERLSRFMAVFDRARRHVAEWSTDDPGLGARLAVLGKELAALGAWLGSSGAALASLAWPWDALARHAENASLDLQELVVSLILEPYGDLVDDLETATGEPRDWLATDPAMTVGTLVRLIESAYGWALGTDFAQPDAQHLFWYASEEKLEPRLGERWSEPGAELETRIGVARDVQALCTAARGWESAATVAEFLLARPRFRYAVQRVQTLAALDYAEIRDNLLARDCLPIDILRCKLAFFGAVKFDPKSDRWVRVTLYQGAPLPDELGRADADDWAFPVAPP